MEQARQILADLRIHQIELRGQNEELRRTQQELEESRQRYFKLYDLAPVGYCTLNAQGVIQEINLTLAALLQMDRADLVGKNLTRFIHPQDYEVYVRFLKSLSASWKACTCEVRMFRRDQGHIQARLRASTEHDATGRAGPPGLGTPVPPAGGQQSSGHFHPDPRLFRLREQGPHGAVRGAHAP